MKRDPLTLLLRLREAAVTEASRELAAGRAREAEQAAALAGFRSTMSEEQSGATGALVETFAAWLPSARQQAGRLQAALAGQEAVVRRLQQTLVARKTEAEAVAKALRRQQAQAAAALARKDQAVMDEAASRSGRAL